MTRIRTNSPSIGPRLVSGPRKDRKKSWIFEKLEDRHFLSANPLVEPVSIGVLEDEVASAAMEAAASSAGVVLPNDPYLEYQWHLFNSGLVPVGDPIEQNIYGVAGEDINVYGAWALGYTGEGVVVAVVDSGVQLDHPDLLANIHETLGYDSITGTDRQTFPAELEPFFPIPGEANQLVPGNAHGTAVAGLISGVGDNGIGGAGVAYNSTIVPILFLNETVGGVNESGDVVSALTYENELIDIYNHSWGPVTPTREVAGPFSPLDPELDALRNSATLGRDGLGNIHVFSSGNDAGPSYGSASFLGLGTWDYAGYNGYVNSRYTIAVTGVDHDGQYNNVDGTFTSYPEASASVLVAAPTGSNVQELGTSAIAGSGIWTTDFYNADFDPDDPAYDPDSPFYDPFQATEEGYNGPTVGILEPFDYLYDRFEDSSYTSRYNGTSAAAPIASGVIALMLEANPDLSYRDVQNILVRSARQNAQFEEMGDGLTYGTYGTTIDNTWTVNRNEFFHTPDSFDGILYRQNGAIDDLDLFDDSRTGTANDFIDSAVGSADTMVYNPILDPDSYVLGELDDPFPENDNVILTNTLDPAMFATGAGFTVSLGRGDFGTGVGYGHGVIDAELAVKLAEQYTEYLPTELSWTTGKQQATGDDWGPEEIGGTSFLVVPGRLESADQISAIEPLFSETPDLPAGNTFSMGDDFLPVIVPEMATTNPQDGFNSNMVVEWVEVRFALTDGDLDETRITLVSPDGTHSELVNYFDLDEGQRSYQYDIAANLVGSPAGTTDAAEWVFTTNRHWGERSDNTIKIDPATGEPYAGAPEQSWQIHIESFDGGNATINYEVIFHGSPVAPETQRIQGFVGVDEFRADQYDIDDDGDVDEVVQDGYFNYDRWIQIEEDIFLPTNIDPENDSLLENAIFNRLNISYINSGNGTTSLLSTEDPSNPGVFTESLIGIASESLANGDVAFNRLGEVERVLDTTQESFAENVAVQLFREYRSGEIDATPYQEFITGADGNYYFDVVAPVDDSFDIDLVFGEGLTDSQQAVFQEAVGIWESIIVDDIPDVDLGGDFFIDDVVITASGTYIDGPSSVLGQAGPTQLRPDSMLPSQGSMQFDVADLEVLEADGELLTVILHEMAHVLGFGTIWAELDLLENPSEGEPEPLDTRFLGENATVEYNTLLGGGTEVSVPVENEAGPGSVDSHWRESVFNNELMTPFINSGGANPLSRLTIAQFADLGYTVDYEAAEEYSLFGAPIAAAAGGMIEIMDVTPEVLDADVVAPASASDDVVAYVMRVVDGEGRETIAADSNAADGFMPHYSGEWRLTSDYFSASAHEGRSPEFATMINPGAVDPDNPGTSETFVEGVSMRIVDSFGAQDGLFSADTGAAISAVVDNLGMSFPPQLIQFVDDTGAPVLAYDDMGAPLLMDAAGDPAIILDWDPTPTGGNAQQYILINPTIDEATNEDRDIIYTLDSVTGEITGTPVDPEEDPFTITIFADWSHIIVDAEGEVEEVDGLLEIYDGGSLVTVEQDMGGTYYFVATSNIRTDLVFTPEIDTHDLAVTEFGALSSAIYEFNPTQVYDVLMDEDGTPVSYIDSFYGGRVADDVRGINFLLDSGVAPDLEGQVFIDANDDQAYNPADGDVGKAGAIVYVDINDDGEFQSSVDLFAESDDTGQYAIDLSTIEGSRYAQVRIVGQPGFTLTSPASGSYLTYLGGGVDLSGQSFDFGFEVGGDVIDPDAPAAIVGTVFQDSDGDGVLDGDEPGLPGITVFIDDDNDGELDEGERETTSNAGGVYQFTDMEAGDVYVAIVVESPYAQTTPEGSHLVTLEGGLAVTDVDFGVMSLANRDFGDLGGSYATTIAQDGASHWVVPGITLGTLIDMEVDGQPTDNATGDDVSFLADEDGVQLVQAVTPGQFGNNNPDVIDPGDEITLDITVQGVGFMLNAWFDWNGDGDFDDADEHVYANQDLNPGTWRAGESIDTDGQIALPTITAPGEITTGAIGARFRWGEGDLLPTGDADYGEVEDYVYNYDSGVLVPNVVLGDYSGNGVVDIDDYHVWRASYGATSDPSVNPLPADGNGDGRVDLADYTVWRDSVPGSTSGGGVEADSLGGGIVGLPRATEILQLQEYLAVSGYEIDIAYAGSGATAKQYVVYRLISEPLLDLAVTDTTQDSSPAGEELVYAPATSVRGSYTTPLRSSLGDSLSEQSPQVARLSQLDLALTLLDQDEAIEEETIDFFGSSEEMEPEEALAVALADEELFTM